MTDKGPSQEAIEAAGRAIAANSIYGGYNKETKDHDWVLHQNIYRSQAETAILAYHKHLASKGLKVTSEYANDPWVVVDDRSRCRKRVKIVAERLLKTYQNENPDDGVGGFGKDWRHFVGKAQQIVEALMHDAAPEVFG